MGLYYLSGMSILIKNNRTDILSFNLQNPDVSKHSYVGFINPNDVVRQEMGTALMQLSLNDITKGHTWEGFVPSDTTEPINIGSNPDGSIVVHFDETIIPNIIPPLEAGNSLYICVFAGIFLFGLLCAFYYRRKNRS